MLCKSPCQVSLVLIIAACCLAYGYSVEKEAERLPDITFHMKHITKGIDIISLFENSSPVKGEKTRRTIQVIKFQCFFNGGECQFIPWDVLFAEQLHL